MTTATSEKRTGTGTKDDYGQALAEGEITRILKTVQAAQFKKSGTLVTTEDKEFKPRSLVEIAFAAEQKRKQAEEVFSQQQAETQSPQAEDADTISTSGDDEVFEDTEQAVQKAEETALQKRAEEDQAIRLAAEEDGYKRGFEAGLKAARTAEPTAEEITLLEEKEQQRQAVVALFHDAIAALASPQAVDSSALEAAISKAVLELASERAGQVISENPEGILVRIRGLIDSIKAAAHRADIFMNPIDLDSLENWLKDVNFPSDWKFVADTQLLNGDIRIKIGGIEISDQLNIPAELKTNALEENSVELNKHLGDEELDEDLDGGLDEDLDGGLDEDLDGGLDEDLDGGLDEDLDGGLDEDLDGGLDEDLDGGLAEDLDGGLAEEVEKGSRTENATIPSRPPFIPVASEEFEEGDNDLLEAPEKEGSNESDKE